MHTSMFMLVEINQNMLSGKVIQEENHGSTWPDHRCLPIGYFSGMFVIGLSSLLIVVSFSNSIGEDSSAEVPERRRSDLDVPWLTSPEE